MAVKTERRQTRDRVGEGSAEGTIGSAQHQEDCRGYLGTVVPLDIPVVGSEGRRNRGPRPSLVTW